MAFELEQLVKPHGILVGRAPRIGRDPPARLDRPAIDEREDDVGITGIDRKQHGRALAAPPFVHNSTSPARTMSSAPSSRRSRRAPSASRPSKRPVTVSS